MSSPRHRTGSTRLQPQPSRLGRRLPEGGRFATVGELFDLDADIAERTELWNPGTSLGWQPLARLLRYGSREATLTGAPSGMVVVVREVPS